MADTGAQSTLVGDNLGLDLPQAKMPETELVVEKNMARFSKTKEFKVLKDYLEGRIEYFKTFQPDGKAMVLKDVKQDLVNDWFIANTIIGEFKAVLDIYENANEEVAKSVARRNTEL